MKKYLRDNSILNQKSEIHVVMYLRPTIYESSKILSAVYYDKKTRRYHTDVNPDRIINGPLSEYKQELESPIRDEYNSFIEDCKFLIEETGFTIISQSTSEDSKKSEYFIVFGIDDTPYGKLVYDLRISDHPFDATFPEEAKAEVMEYLKINKVLDGSATEAGIDFSVEKITVGGVRSDTWDRAFTRLYNKLKTMRKRIQVQLNRQNNS